AGALGYRDHEEAPADEVFAAVARIVRAVDVPVTADLEAGYGLAPAELVDRMLAAGVVGCNLEDSDHRAGGLVDIDLHAARLAELGVARISFGGGLHILAQQALRRALHRVNEGADPYSR